MPSGTRTPASQATANVVAWLVEVRGPLGMPRTLGGGQTSGGGYSLAPE